MADTLNISDEVTAQARTKVAHPTPLISSILKDLNELIFTDFKIHGEKEKFHNKAEGLLQCPPLRTGEGHVKNNKKKNCRVTDLNATQG